MGGGIRSRGANSRCNTRAIDQMLSMRYTVFGDCERRTQTRSIAQVRGGDDV